MTDSAPANVSRTKGLPFILALAVFIITLLFLIPLHFDIFSNGLVAAGIICVIYFRRRPDRWELAAVLGCALLLALIRLAFSGESKFSPVTLSTIAVFLALACLFMLVLPVVWAPESEQKSRMSDLGLALGVPVFAMGIGVPLWLEAGLSPHTLDYNLYAFDSSLGFYPSFWLGRILANNAWLSGLCGVAYYGLPLMFVILATGPEVKLARPNLVKIMLVAGVVGGTLYMVVPASSPLFVLHSRFPFNPPPVDQFRRIALLNPPRIDFRNCMPSLHFGWTLLIYLNVRWSRWRRIGAGLLLALIAIATVGFGQHYLIDLIVAVPFILAVQEASERLWPPVIVNGTLTMAWLLALRFERGLLSEPAFLAWVLVIGTLAVAIAAHSFEFNGRTITVRRLASEKEGALLSQSTTETT